jgi:hypothetical protein
MIGEKTFILNRGNLILPEWFDDPELEMLLDIRKRRVAILIFIQKYRSLTFWIFPHYSGAKMTGRSQSAP